MTPRVTAALADLDFRLRAMDELRKALDVHDFVTAQRVADRLPSWSWPASLAPALAELRAESRVTADPPPERDWHPDGFGGAR